MSGTLAFSTVNSSSFTLVQGSMTVAAGGTLTLGTAANPIAQGSTATLVLAYGSSAGQYGLVINNGGNMIVHGATKTVSVRALSEVPAGATSLTLDGTSLTGWSVGDWLIIGKTNPGAANETERVQITALSGLNPMTVSFTPALVYSHTLPWVMSLSRNAVVRSSGTNTSANTAYVQNLARNATSFRLTYGEFAYLGSNNAGKYGLTWDGSAVRGSISSSTVHDGYYGISINYSGNNTLSANTVSGNGPSRLRVEVTRQ